MYIKYTYYVRKRDGQKGELLIIIVFVWIL